MSSIYATRPAPDRHAGMTGPDLVLTAVCAEIEEDRTDRGIVHLIRLFDDPGRTVALFRLSRSLRLKRLDMLKADHIGGRRRARGDIVEPEGVAGRECLAPGQGIQPPRDLAQLVQHGGPTKHNRSQSFGNDRRIFRFERIPNGPRKSLQEHSQLTRMFASPRQFAFDSRAQFVPRGGSHDPTPNAPAQCRSIAEAGWTGAGGFPAAIQTLAVSSQCTNPRDSRTASVCMPAGEAG